MEEKRLTEEAMEENPATGRKLPADEEIQKKGRPPMEEEALQLQKKALFWTRLTGVCSALILCCMLALTISFLRYQPRVNAILTKLDHVAVELEDGSRELTRTMRSLNEEGLKKIYQTLDNVQKIDIEKLNDSIDSLHRIISPLAKLFQ